MNVSTERSANPIQFDERGLVACVMQDWLTGEVLTLAYMNEQALRLTLETGEIHFYSRSRDEIWHKGASSGNRQLVRQIRYDCDGDALVVLVEPTGPACHTGKRSCFHRGLDALGGEKESVEDEPGPAVHEAPAILERAILDRQRARPPGSYTVELLDDPSRVGDKVREEADEVARAAASESDVRLVEESADLIYHLQVLLASRGISVAAALETLNGRRG
jgi:phosphoribosyl-ATP pyrophosphohydrolase/phosphoribosyl-AMP cyclohydrolase